MLNIATKILLHSFFSVTIFAQTPFILEQFSTAHIVVKADSNKILDKYKTNIYELLNEYADDLGISASRLSRRVLGVKIHLLKVTKELSIIELELYIHEPTLRLEDKQEIFSISYQNRSLFVVNDIEEDIEDNLITLLEEFSTQYEEDNE